MGGKSGKGQSTPYEAPNSLSSAQSLRIIDVVCEGEVEGFANGNEHPFKSIFFDDTPVQNADGSFNFKGVVGFFQRGTPDQSYIPGFDAAERTVAVSTAVKKSTPVVRAVSDNLVSRLRITVGVERNSEVKANGDVYPAVTNVLIELVGDKGTTAGQTVTFNEKSSGVYYQDVIFNKLPPVPFNIRVSRETADSTTDKISNNTYFASYVEIVDAKLSYPNSVVSALMIDSDQFGGNVPRINYLMKNQRVGVPATYDPEKRTYSSQIWDGSFKWAWTDNPAWHLYDVLTQPRYSTLARRLKLYDVDKWSLYEAAKYCDQMVPDGMGGMEPRYACNAYITDDRQAGEFILDMASAFCGLPIWDGNKFSVVLDKDSDPVALYTNANVVDGMFTYAGAAYKSIHTAINVQYLDKNDGYRSKIESVKNDAAIARYGLNVKSVTAFGCTSRGQAVRFGEWTLQTELRQQNTVSFTVGREGLKHLPYDIIQVMDNQYAGAEMSGRVVAVAGDLVTLDRDVEDVAGAMLYVPGGKEVVSAKISAAVAKNQVRLERALNMQPGDTWAMSGKVKTRLYRAIGIKENTDDGTYTITALLHDPRKYDSVDRRANFNREINTLHTLQPVLIDGDVSAENGAIVLTWDNLTANGQVLTYDIKIYRNGKLYRHIPDAKTAEIRLESLPNGNYRAEIRGRNARGVLSEPLIKAWTIDYTVTGLRTKPLTFAIGVTWVVPPLAVAELVSEVWYSKTNDIQTATKLASLAYPQNTYTLTGVGVAETYYFWVRMVDKAGNTGEFTAAVEGHSDRNPAPLVEALTGAITSSALSKELIGELNDVMANEAGELLKQEAQARTLEIQQATAAQGRALTETANAIGNRINKVEEVNTNQSKDLTTITARMDGVPNAIAAGVEVERKARVTAIEAEGNARQLLAARVGDAEGALRQEATVRAAADKLNADNLISLTGRVGGAESSITRLEQTKLNRQQAEAVVSESIKTQFQTADTRNDNRPPSWYWSNYPRQSVTEFKMSAAIGVPTASGRSGALDTVVPWNDASGGVIHQTFITDTGQVLRRKSDVAYTYAAATGYSYTRDLWTAWIADETVVGSQAKADAAKLVAEAAAALARQTSADYQQFIGQYAKDKEAWGRVETELKAEIKNVGVGGRNLLLNSNLAYSSSAYSTRYQLAEAPKVGEDVVVTLWGSIGSDRSGIGVFNSQGYSEITKLVKISDGIYRGTGKWVKPMNGATEVMPNDTHLNVYFYPNTSASINTINRIKLERGSNGSDWTPAPEDVDASVSARVKSVSDVITNLDGKVQAMHTLKVETLNNGQKVAAGIAMGADGNTGQATMLFYGNSFGFVEQGSEDVVMPLVTVIKNNRATMALRGDIIADGTVHGKSIVAGTEIITPVLQSAVVNAGRINSTEINNGNGNLTISSDGVLRAKHGYFEGTVRADRIEGVLVDFLTSGAPTDSTSYSRPTRSVYKNYTFTKTDVRAGIVTISPVDALLMINNRVASTSVVARVYLNEVLVSPRVFSHIVDGVDTRNVTCGLALNGTINFPTFKVGVGTQTIRVELYGFMESASTVTINTPSRLTAIVGY